MNPNDNEDGTGFGNKTQNYPELTSAQSDGDRTTVRGTLNSTPNAIFRVEFFASEKTNATRYGDGQRYLGAIMVGTDSDGNADIIATLAAVSTGQFISATATRPGYNTSEFSQVVEVNPTTSGPSANGPSISARRRRTRTTRLVPRREDHPGRFSRFPSPSTWRLIRPGLSTWATITCSRLDETEWSVRRKAGRSLSAPLLTIRPRTRSR